MSTCWPSRCVSRWFASDERPLPPVLGRSLPRPTTASSLVLGDQTLPNGSGHCQAHRRYGRPRLNEPWPGGVEQTAWNAIILFHIKQNKVAFCSINVAFTSVLNHGMYRSLSRCRIARGNRQRFECDDGVERIWKDQEGPINVVLSRGTGRSLDGSSLPLNQGGGKRTFAWDLRLRGSQAATRGTWWELQAMRRTTGHRKKPGLYRQRRS